MAKRILAAFVIFALSSGSVSWGPRSTAPIGAVTSADAQERVVRVDGLVQWIGGLRMVLQTDTGPSVGVDLASVPQSEYAGLVVRERVAVIGMVSADNRDIVGTSVVRADRGR
jgi:hypothetical protein